MNADYTAAPFASLSVQGVHIVLHTEKGITDKQDITFLVDDIGVTFTEPDFKRITSAIETWVYKVKDFNEVMQKLSESQKTKLFHLLICILGASVHRPPILLSISQKQLIGKRGNPTDMES